ncbi:TPA: hypothetical protein EYP66_12430 [Candidatus Poribacteria bacterium]|nr:hypothetical protein [Candidatus Poribacteria bacterium]
MVKFHFRVHYFAPHNGYPFSLDNHIQIGYECGFGNKNSAGFGMVEVVKMEPYEAFKCWW